MRVRSWTRWMSMYFKRFLFPQTEHATRGRWITLFLEGLLLPYETFQEVRSVVVGVVRQLQGLERHEATQSMIKAAAEGDR